MITLHLGRQCGWTSWTLQSLFSLQGMCYVKANNISSELWMYLRVAQSEWAPRYQHKVFFNTNVLHWGMTTLTQCLLQLRVQHWNGKSSLQKLFEPPCPVLHAVQVDKKIQHNSNSWDKNWHWVSSPTFNHKCKMQGHLWSDHKLCYRCNITTFLAVPRNALKGGCRHFSLSNSFGHNLLFF